jgi:hypothetical protein
MFTLQGGNFQSGGIPVANGSVVLSLSNPLATVIATGAAAMVTYIFNLDANGNLPAGSQVFGNAELTPGGTFYTAQVFTGPNGTGTLVSTATWVVGPSAPYAGTLFPNVTVLPVVSFTGQVILPRSVVTFSATPAFNAAVASSFDITLTGNVTSSTLTGPSGGQLIVFAITQDGVGGRTFVFPTNVKGAVAIDPAAGKKSTQAFWYDGTNAIAISAMQSN